MDIVRRPDDWTCPSCGQAVSLDFDVCLGCGSNRQGQRIVDFGSDEDDFVEDVPIHANSAAGDALAARAWRAAILSPFLCPPSLNVYSLWLILRIALSDAELSAAGKGKFYMAMLVNVAVWAGLSIVWRYFFT